MVKRKTYLDFLRIIAIFMVLYNHTGTNGFMLFTVRQESALYPLYLAISVAVKVAVPLFFMISGALLLGKNESLECVLKKRICKYLLVLVVASFVAYLPKNYTNFSFTAFLKTLYSNQVSANFWYLYAYLGFLVMLPFLRRLAQAMTHADYRWMFVVYAGMQVLVIVEFLITKGSLTYNGNFSLFILKSAVFYPLMGYFIDQKMEDSKSVDKKLALLWVLSAASIAVCCWLTHYKCTLTNQWSEAASQTFLGTLAFVPAITVFAAAKLWFHRHDLGDSVSDLIMTVGGTTFGIYLFEEIYRWVTKGVFIWLDRYVPTLVACVVWILAACVLGGAVTYLLKKIPGVKRFL